MGNQGPLLEDETVKIAKIYKQYVTHPNPRQWVNGMPEATDLIFGSAQYSEAEREWKRKHSQYLDEDGCMTQEGIDKMSEECGDAAHKQFECDQMYDCGDFVIRIVSDDMTLLEMDRPWS